MMGSILCPGSGTFRSGIEKRLSGAMVVMVVVVAVHMLIMICTEKQGEKSKNYLTKPTGGREGGKEERKGEGPNDGVI